MGKKTRKSRNKKPASQQSANNKSNNEEQLAVVPDTVIPAEGPVDDVISTPSPKTDDNVVDSTNDKDAIVNTSERIDDDNTVQMIHSANDEADLIKSPKQDTNVDDQEVAIVVTNNTNGDNEVIDTTDDTTEDNEKEPRPLVIAGPSGAGKGTLIGILMEKFPSDQFGFSVSHTTRKPREGEIDGVHYNFTTVEEMKKEIDGGKFIEYANVHGNYYGTSVTAVSSVQSKGQICILDIDVQGVQNVKKSSLNPYYVFIAPPSMDILEARLRGRGTDNEESIKKRLENARDELEYGQEEGNFDKYLVNCDLNEAAAELCATVKVWYRFLQKQEENQQQSDEGTHDEIKSDKDLIENDIDNSKSCFAFEADMPDDEAKDEISEAKTEVVDNTTDDLDSCDDDNGDACEIVEDPVVQFDEDHPEDEVEIEGITTPMTEEVNSTDLNSTSTESKEIVKENDSTPETNTDSVQDVSNPLTNTINGIEEVKGNNMNNSVTESKEMIKESNSATKTDAAVAQNTNSSVKEASLKEAVTNKNITTFYTLQELKVPIEGVDWACREEYLSDDDIIKYFGMNRDELRALPKWKRQAAKKKLGIF